MQNRWLLFKYQPRFYNVQSSDDVNHRVMKFWWNNKLFPSLNVFNEKPSPYGSKDVLRYYYYRSYTKLGPVIVSIIIIPWSCHACKNNLSLPLDSVDIRIVKWSFHTRTRKLYPPCEYTIKWACNHPRYGIVYTCKYSLIFGCHNNWIIMNYASIEIYVVAMLWTYIWSLLK